MKKNKTTISTIINGRDCDAIVDDNLLLADYLREDLGLFGTKIGCDGCECGCCTVLIDGTPHHACLTLAAKCDGKTIETIESLSEGSRLSAIQRGFNEKLGAQCGFCTPGQVMSAVALLNVNPNPTREEARQALSGNLCRCGAYDHYLNGVMRAAREV